MSNITEVVSVSFSYATQKRKTDVKIIYKNKKYVLISWIAINMNLWLINYYPIA